MKKRHYLPFARQTVHARATETISAAHNKKGIKSAVLKYRRGDCCLQLSCHASDIELLVEFKSAKRSSMSNKYLFGLFGASIDQIVDRPDRFQQPIGSGMQPWRACG
jgi:hypothetical protein